MTCNIDKSVQCEIFKTVIQNCSSETEKTEESKGVYTVQLSVNADYASQCRVAGSRFTKLPPGI